MSWPRRRFAQRVLADELLELGDQLGVAAERQISLDPTLERDQPLLLQAGDVALRERLVREVRQWRPAPQRERLAQPVAAARRIPVCHQPTAVREQALEPDDVDVVGTDLGDVAVAARQHHLTVGGRLQLLAQLRDVHVQALGRRRRRPLAPQLVDQALRRDHLVRVHQQQSQQRPAPSSSDLDRTIVVRYLQRSEQAEVHFTSPRGDTSRPSAHGASGRPVAWRAAGGDGRRAPARPRMGARKLKPVFVRTAFPHPRPQHFRLDCAASPARRCDPGPRVRIRTPQPGVVEPASELRVAPAVHLGGRGSDETR